MKAFWASVAVAIVIAIVAGVVLRMGVRMDAQHVYQSQTGDVKL